MLKGRRTSPAEAEHFTWSHKPRRGSVEEVRGTHQTRQREEHSAARNARKQKSTYAGVTKSPSNASRGITWQLLPTASVKRVGIMSLQDWLGRRS